MDLVHVIAVFPLGLYLGWITLQSGSLFPAMIGHFVNNSIQRRVGRIRFGREPRNVGRPGTGIDGGDSGIGRDGLGRRLLCFGDLPPNRIDSTRLSGRCISMFSLRLGFDHPNYLWLLLALPLLWWIGYRSLASLGSFRRLFALLFRSVVWTAIVFALAGVQLVWVSDRMTVMYLLDQSESIPQANRQVMLDYVIRNVRRHRNPRAQ